jgi:uncharacterized cupin superfamily protein
MCTLIDGILAITQDGGQMVTYNSGDSFFMAKGFSGSETPKPGSKHSS